MPNKVSSDHNFPEPNGQIHVYYKKKGNFILFSELEIVVHFIRKVITCQKIGKLEINQHAPTNKFIIFFL